MARDSALFLRRALCLSSNCYFFIFAFLQLIQLISSNEPPSGHEDQQDPTKTNDGKSVNGQEDDGLCFGIDLGTTYSVLSLNDHNNHEIIVNSFGNPITPSIVAFDSGEVLVGESAARVSEPTRVARTVKRIMGRLFEEKRVQDEIHRVKHKIVRDNNNRAAIEIDGVVHTPEEISGHILESLLRSAHRYTETHYQGKKKVKGAVITVPAYFKHNERSATIEAAKHAGINPLKILSEPVAAAIANTDMDLEGKTVVIDIGGGTTDVSVLDVEDGIYSTISVDGDPHLGGVDFDNIIIDMLRENHHDLDQIIGKDFNIFEFAETLKIQLSSKQIVDYELPDGIHKGSLNRIKFNMKLKPFMDEVVHLTKEAIKKANLTISDIDNILLVGGVSRTPYLKERIKSEFNMEPKISKKADSAVALGAAIVAAQECGHSDAETILISHIPFGLGVKALQGTQTITVFIIENGSPVPTKKTKTFLTAQDNQTAVTVEVYQGFSIDVSENTPIGIIQYENLPPARAGQIKVDIEFEITENQVIHVKVKGSHENAQTLSHMITLNAPTLTEEEIAMHQARAERRRIVMEAILEFESKFSQAFYFIDSDITKNGLQESHVKILSDLRDEWKKLKDEVHQNKEISDGEIEEFKARASKMYEDAEPVIQKIVEMGTELSTAYDQKVEAERSATAGGKTSATSSSSTSDL